MQRCLQLAKLGFATVAPNPLVGAVLVYNNNIIGEGYHMQYGQAHAEVNCINNVAAHNMPFIKDATLYVSLEPCNHYGKTPPCSNLIVQQQIKNVVIGCVDGNSKVNGAGIAYLQQNGINVITGVLQNECQLLNETFFYALQKQRPLVTLKWAQSKDGFMNDATKERTLITNHCTNVWVHQLRTNYQAIMVGSNTIAIDNPMLNSRLYGNYATTTIVIDRYLQLNLVHKKILTNKQIVIVNCLQQKTIDNVIYLKINDDELFLQNTLEQLFLLGIQSVLIEGGASLLQLFLQQNLCNKIVLVQNNNLLLYQGLLAPSKWSLPLHQQIYIQNNSINIYS